MAPKSIVPSKMTDLFFDTALRAFNSTLDVLPSPGACCYVDLDPVGLNYQSACTPWPLADLATAPTSPNPYNGALPPAITPQPCSARFHGNTAINLQDIQNIKAEHEVLEIRRASGSNLTPEQQLCPRSTEDSGTNVDALVRTIQLKSRRPPCYPSPSLARNGSPPDLILDLKKGPPQHESTGRGHQRDRKAYKCCIPSCSKMFYQKAHLEIHRRMHTGYKPFVRGDRRKGRRALC